MTDAIRDGDRALPLRRRRVRGPPARASRRAGRCARSPSGSGPRSRGSPGDVGPLVTVSVGRRRSTRTTRRRRTTSSRPPTGRCTSPSRRPRSRPPDGRPDPRPVPRGARPDDAPPARAARAARAAARDRRARRGPRRREARLPVPARGRRRTAARSSSCRVGTRDVRRRYDGYRLPHGTGVGWQVVRIGPADRRRRLRRLPEPGAPDLDAADVRRGVRGAADLRRRGAGHDRARVRRRAAGRSASARSRRSSRFAQLASIALDNARLFERAQTEVRQRAHAALHDMLTGLPNRTAPAEPAGRARWTPAAPASDGTGAGGPRVALILLDLDRFKVVNESLGHAAGDLLLAEVGAPARRRPPGSTDTVARLGGDEFGVLLGPVRSVREAERVAARIERRRRRAVRPRRPGGHRQRQPRPGGRPGRRRRTPATCSRRRRSPSTGPSSTRSASSSCSTPRCAPRRSTGRPSSTTSGGPSSATSCALHYQPLVDLGTGTVVGLEALAPLAAPDPRPRPAAVVHPARRGDRADPADRAVGPRDGVPPGPRLAARATRRRRPLVMSVNLSARQFAQPDLVDRRRGDDPPIDRARRRPPSSSRSPRACVDGPVRGSRRAAAAAPRRSGVRLVLDDFGTGYSSLSYLRRLPLDTIKIDRSFVIRASTSRPRPTCRSSRRSISLAHGLGIDVVAEGIETAAQLAALRELGCDRGQGYVFARPLPPDASRRCSPSGDAAADLEVAPAA